jgi:hypothetical protein
MENETKVNTFIVESISIDEIIKLKEKEKQQQTLLIEFKNKYQKDDKISVKEFQTYYELTIDHPSKNDYTGGAECYKLDKKSGKTNMIWHEHPMKLPKLELE